MEKQNKKIFSFLAVIAIAILFSLSPMPDYIHGISHVDAPWLHRTDQDMIKDLRMQMWNLQLSVSFLSQENRMLRTLAYTGKPKQWNTWLELLDHIKRQNKVIEKQKRRIRVLENALGIRQDRMLQPYRRI